MVTHVDEKRGSFGSWGSALSSTTNLVLFGKRQHSFDRLVIG